MNSNKQLLNALWLDKPSEKWLDAFPIGNGHLGAMVFGNVCHERIALNHENLWRGTTKNRTTDPKHQHLSEIREALLQEKWIEGSELAAKYLSGNHDNVMPYQPVGDLLLKMPESSSVICNYKRYLDIANGLAEVSYTVDDITYYKTVFASAVNGVIVVNIKTDKPGIINLNCKIDRIEDPDCTICHWLKENCFGFTGEFIEGIKFAVEARVFIKKGKLISDGISALEVSNADEFTLIMTIAVDYNEPNPAQWCSKHLDNVPTCFDTLIASHKSEHRSLFDRVELTLDNDNICSLLPIDKRLELIREGHDDPSLLELYFHFGRYLLMSSSRNCDQPANLQGVWNEELHPPWNCDIHSDINVQMNYWPAEVCNLSECINPLFQFIERGIPQGKKIAQDLYNCRGLCYCLQTDIWDHPTPESVGWDVWTGAAAWLAQHLWQRYEYSLDKIFLKKSVYPFLKLVAEFYENYLIEDSEGRLVTVPSQSPENFFVGGTQPVSLCVGSTMDFILIREVLSNCLKSINILGVDEELEPKWENILNKIPSFQIGKYGQLQEWLQDFDEGELDHRHYSHLYGVFPGELMTSDSLPEFYKAARISLERRIEAGCGQTGWNSAWTACLWTRFSEGSLAYKHIFNLFRNSTTNSLLDLYPPQIFQIDGNFGGTAAIAEMLLQSYGDTIYLLPALPHQLSNGKISGFCARGGFKIDISWQSEKLIKADIQSELGGECKIVLPEGNYEAWVNKTINITVNDKTIQIDTKPLDLITIKRV